MFACAERITAAMVFFCAADAEGSRAISRKAFTEGGSACWLTESRARKTNNPTMKMGGFILCSLRKRFGSLSTVRALTVILLVANVWPIRVIVCKRGSKIVNQTAARYYIAS